MYVDPPEPSASPEVAEVAYWGIPIYRYAVMWLSVEFFVRVRKVRLDVTVRVVFPADGCFVKINNSGSAFRRGRETYEYENTCEFRESCHDLCEEYIVRLRKYIYFLI